jgi:GT2 family glycosyltransferase
MPSSFAVLIVNWNSHQDVSQVLESIPGDAPVVIVDNNSPDLPQLRNLIAAKTNTTLIESEVNGGYGAGMNLAIKYVLSNLDCEAVLLLNPDVILDDQFLDNVESLLGSVDILGFQQFSLSDSGKTQFYPCAAYFDRGRIKLKPRHASGSHPTDIVTGAAILIQCSAFENVGLFDESFFHYKEEFDLCFRMKLAGRSIAINYDFPLLHNAGSSLAHESLNAIYYQVRNEILFAKKHPSISIRRSTLNVLGVIKYCASLTTKGRYWTIFTAVCDGLLQRSGIRKVK